MASPLAQLRAWDLERGADRADVDDRLVELHRRGARAVRFEGAPAPGGHGRVVLTFTLPSGPVTVEASTYAVALDRAEAATR